MRVGTALLEFRRLQVQMLIFREKAADLRAHAVASIAAFRTVHAESLLVMAAARGGMPASDRVSLDRRTV